MAVQCVRNVGLSVIGVLGKPYIYSFSLRCLQERHATYKLHQHKSKRKPPGVKVLEGEYVKAGETLVDQTGMFFHPGLNVDVTYKRTLVALVTGQVVITAEKANPKSNHILAQKNYHLPTPHTVYKKYFNVIPFTQSKKFNLVDLV